MSNRENGSESKRKVVVTGASGLVGSALCDALLNLGDHVVGLSRSPEKSAQAQPAVQWFGWESTKERPPAEALDGADAVIHLAGEPINQRWNQEVKDRIARSRIKSTKNMAEAISTRDNPPSVFRLRLGHRLLRRPRRRTALRRRRTGRRFPRRRRGRMGGRRRHRRPASTLRVAKIRTGHVLDPNGGLLGELLTPFKLGVGGPIASGKQYMSWIHRDDEVGILLWALENEAAVGPINATAPNPVTNKEFAKRLGKALSRPAFMPIPGFALDALRGPRVRQRAARGPAGLPPARHRERLRVQAARTGRSPGQPAALARRQPLAIDQVFLIRDAFFALPG